MKLKLLSLFSILTIFIEIAVAQIPVTVNRSTVTTGGSVSLPAFNGTATLSGSSPLWTLTGSAVTGTTGNPWATIGGGCSASPARVVQAGGGNTPISMTASPSVTISTNAPSSFTNSITGLANYSASQSGSVNTLTISQSYAVTIVEDGSGGGGSSTVASVRLTGQADALEAISRNSTDTSQRKLLGFALSANTNSSLSSLVFGLSNTSTNTAVSFPLNFSSLVLWRDAAGDGNFDSGDIPLATTTNLNGLAVFTGLSQTLHSTNTTFFLSGSFMPTNQTKNSFLTSSLSPIGITVFMASTNVAISITGGSALGKQYAFLDNTAAEDAAYALGLTNGLLNASQVSTLISSATSGLGNSSSKSQSSSLSDSVLPAVAAGAAGVAAAFSSDSLSRDPLSSEFTPPQ